MGPDLDLPPVVWNLLAVELRGEHAAATVVSNGQGQVRSADVTFVTRAGEGVTAAINFAGPAANGESVPIVYDREKPTRVRDARSLFSPDFARGVVVVVPLLGVLAFSLRWLVRRRTRRAGTSPANGS